MKKRNNTFAHAIVGFFMVALVALLSYFTIVVSGVDLLAGRKRRQVQIVFDQVGGLKERDSVMFRGTKVGSVERIAVTPSNLVVTVAVDESVVFRRGCRAAACGRRRVAGRRPQAARRSGAAAASALGLESFAAASAGRPEAVAGVRRQDAASAGG